MDSPVSGPSCVEDLSESLLASQSGLGPYWGRGVSRKRDRAGLVDLSMDEESSKGPGGVRGEPGPCFPGANGREDMTHAKRGHGEWFPRVQGEQFSDLAGAETTLGGTMTVTVGDSHIEGLHGATQWTCTHPR